MNHKQNMVSRVFYFYVDGFKRMKLGKTLWAIILIKLFIMFAILKVFFFPNYLNTKFSTDEEKSEYILESLTKSENHD